MAAAETSHWSSNQSAFTSPAPLSAVASGSSAASSSLSAVFFIHGLRSTSSGGRDLLLVLDLETDVERPLQSGELLGDLSMVLGDLGMCSS